MENVATRQLSILPDFQVTKSIEGLLSLQQIHNPNDPRIKDLKELEAIKKAIDQKSHSLVRRELQAGLGYMILQTALFMRLTFWELTWTLWSQYVFMSHLYTSWPVTPFLLRTSKEPSFEGFYQSRFESKQRKLMEAQNFDVGRYDELKKLFYPKPSSAAVSKILGSIQN
ncbi:unnamed protein product [Brassica rapa subsp. narinosa]